MGHYISGECSSNEAIICVNMQLSYSNKCISCTQHCKSLVLTAKTNWKHFDTEEDNFNLLHLIKHCITIRCIYPGGSEEKDHWSTKQRCGLGRHTIADEPSTPASTLVVHPITHTYAQIHFAEQSFFHTFCAWLQMREAETFCVMSFVSGFL